MIKFVVVGKPYGQKRPRAYRKGRFIGVYSPKENIEHTKMVIEAYQSSKNKEFFDDSTPVAVKITAYYSLPKVSKKELLRNPKKYAMPLRKPDLDNIAKGILDSLTDTQTCWHDDSQVVELIVSKAYVAMGTEERVEVEIWEKKVS